MYWYIVGFFTLGMLGVWLLVVLYTMMVKPKEGDSSSTFKKVLKRSGILVLVYVVTMVVGTMVFSSMYEKECAPNEEDVKVMRPMAEAISNYIVKHGIPKSLKEIPDLPYALEGCRQKKSYPYAKNEKSKKMTINEVGFISFDEECMIKNKKIQIVYHYGIYSKKLNKNSSSSISIRMENNITKTGSLMKLLKLRSGKIIIKKAFSTFSRKDDGICNPMRM